MTPMPPGDGHLEIENCPITPEIQEALHAIIDQLLPERADRTKPQNQMSQLLVVFRDGGLLSLSALTKDEVTGKQMPIAKEYSTPIDAGRIEHSTSLTVLSGTNPAGMLAASIWRWIGGIHRCTGG